VLEDGQSSDRRLAITRAFEALCETGPLARSDLRRLLGTSMSTISGAVHDLIAAGLVNESGRGRSTGGRQPMLLDLAPGSGGVLAADIGAINLRAASGDLRGDRIAVAKRATPMTASSSGLRAALDELLDEVREQLRGSVRGIAISVAGIVDPNTGEVSQSESIPGWDNVDLLAWLGRFEAPLFVENEANAAAIGELARGAARPLRDVVLIAMGAGVGAGVILDRRLFRGRAGAAGEIGSLPLVSSSARELEGVAGATALTRRYRERANGRVLTAAEIFALARDGDETASVLVEEALDSLALGIASAVVLLAPEAIVLGGGYAGAGDYLVSGLAQRVRRMVPRTPPILLGELGPEAAVIGALEIAAENSRRALAVQFDRGRLVA
jgi:glucokinase